MSALLVAAATADIVAVVVHGVVGHRWLRAQLGAVALPESALFGDADVGQRVIWVTWHAVTAMFAVSGAALGLMAFGGEARSSDLLHFIAALHAAVLLVGLVFLVQRLDAVVRPVPPIFVTCMTTVVVASLMAS